MRKLLLEEMQLAIDANNPYGTKILNDDTVHTRFNGIDMDRAERLFEKTQQRDKIKTAYCEQNRIRLIRISYKDIRENKYREILSSLIH